MKTIWNVLIFSFLLLGVFSTVGRLMYVNHVLLPSPEGIVKASPEGKDNASRFFHSHGFPMVADGDLEAMRAVCGIHSAPELWAYDEPGKSFFMCGEKKLFIPFEIWPYIHLWAVDNCPDGKTLRIIKGRAICVDTLAPASSMKSGILPANCAGHCTTKGA